MRPILPFEQRDIHPTQGHCFAVAAKWVGLMLEDEEAAGDYLSRKVSKKDAAVSRSWRQTMLRMQTYAQAGAADAAADGAAVGLPAVQCQVASPWIARYAGMAVRVQIACDDVDEDAGGLAAEIAKASTHEAFLVSASSPPHTVGVVRDGGQLLRFDPNHGVYELGADGQWAHAVQEICAQTGFVPDWLLGIELL